LKYFPAKSESRRQTVLTLLAMAAVFIGSRWYYWNLGVRFDDSTLITFWQFLDLSTLQTDLLESLFYLHAQPPLFNLLLGITVKIAPVDYSVLLHGFYLVGGFVLYLLLFQILRHRFSRPGAFFLATLLVVGPEAVAYENWLFYTWPVAILLVAAAHALLRYEVSRQFRYAAIFLGAVTCVCLTRSVFHLVYFGVAGMLLLSIKAPRRAQVAKALVIALTVIGLLYLKNLAVFGFFGSSSWYGMNLWKTASRIMPEKEIAALVQDEKIPAIALIRPFSALADYPSPYHRVPAGFKNVAVLARPEKANGERNLNHIAYVDISRDYFRASSYVIRRQASGYLQTVAKAISIYCRPFWDYGFFLQNRQSLRDVIVLYYLLQPPHFIELSLVVVFLGVLLNGRRGTAAAGRVSCFYQFLVLTIFYVFIVGNLLEFNENNRFRVMTDPLLFLAVLFAVSDIWAALKERYRKKP